MPVQVQDPGEEIGALRGLDGGHALHILGGLLLENPQGVLGGEGAHQTSRPIGHGQLGHLQLIQEGGGPLLVLLGGQDGFWRLSSLVQTGPLGQSQQGADGEQAQQEPLLVHHIAVGQKVLGIPTWQTGQASSGGHPGERNRAPGT